MLEKHFGLGSDNLWNPVVISFIKDGVYMEKRSARSTAGSGECHSGVSSQGWGPGSALLLSWECGGDTELQGERETWYGCLAASQLHSSSLCSL